MMTPHRQQYGLGSFVKKITKPIKKIVKSPLGKAALLAGGAYMAPKLFGTTWGGTGGWGSKLGGLFKEKALLGNLFHTGKGADRKLSLGKMGLGALLTAGTALPFMGGEEEEEVIETPWDVTPDSIANIRQMAADRHPSLAFMPSSDYVQSGFFTGAKDGGLIGLANGGGVAEAQAEQMLKMQYQKYRNQGGTMSYQQFKMAVLQQAQQQGPMAQGQQAPMAQPQMAAQGGRIGFFSGGDLEQKLHDLADYYMQRGLSESEAYETAADELYKKDGGRIGFKHGLNYKSVSEGGDTYGWGPHDTFYDKFGKYFTPYWYMDKVLDKKNKRPKKAEGGLMDLGGMEKDYRAEGGFVPIGGKEKADDVPARLSKNEFVFTADAVRNAGGGDIDAGAEVMENMMNHLEQGGQISEESQGGGEEEMISEEEMIEAPDGAQEMYEQQAMLQSRMA